MYKDVKEDVAVHQLRQELRQLYREVGADITASDLMPFRHCVDAAQQEQLTLLAFARDHEVPRDGGATQHPDI